MGKASVRHTLRKRSQMSTVTMTVSMFIDTEKDLVGMEMELDGVMAALVDLVEVDPRVFDPAMGANFGERTVEISLTATGETEGVAIDAIFELIRTATQSSGGKYHQIDSTFVAA